MSLAGQGAVAIWHDIAPEGRSDFYAWHGREHMPERVGIPGFLRGRRYIALDGAPEFFNLYETAARETVAGCHLLVADEAASAVETAERRLRSEKNAIPRCILLVESWGDVDSFQALCRRIVGDSLFGDTPAPASGLYRLQNSRSSPALRAG